METPALKDKSDVTNDAVMRRSMGDVSVAKAAAGNEIDFKKYRTPELAATVTEIVDVRGKFVGGFKVIFVVFLVFVLLVGALFWGRLNLMMFSITSGYTCLAGLVFALAMAIGRVVSKSLSEMEQLVELLFTVTKQIASDIGAVGSGAVSIPSARKLVEGVYGEVLLPVVEQVVSKSLGWVGWPLLFAYRMTFGRLVRGVIRLVPDTALTRDDETLESKATKALEELDNIACNESQIVNALSWTQRQLDSLGGKARFVVLLPCYIVGATMIALVMSPLVAIYLWG